MIRLRSMNRADSDKYLELHSHAIAEGAPYFINKRLNPIHNMT